MSRKSILTTLAALAALALAAGCGSSTKVPTAIDTAPPAAPTALAVTVAPEGVVVTWADNTTDADFAGFVVRRSVHADETLLVDAPSLITACVDPAPVIGCVNVYAVSAVDLAGNESACATVVVDLAGDRPVPRVADEPGRDELLGNTESPLPSGHPEDREQH